jgi:hypothetical protein
MFLFLYVIMPCAVVLTAIATALVGAAVVMLAKAQAQ